MGFCVLWDSVGEEAESHRPRFEAQSSGRTVLDLPFPELLPTKTRATRRVLSSSRMNVAELFWATI